jgi:hypothetical protein
VAAVKEYPGGFTLLRIHTGGFAMNFHKSSSEAALAWSERSRMQIAGTWPQFSLGSRVADRNLVVDRDLSGLKVAPEPEATTRPPARAAAAGGDDGVGDDGFPALPVAGGVVALSAIAGATIAVRRRREG